MNKIRIYILGLFVFAFFQVFSQTVAPFKYFIQFTNKNNTPYSISRPEAFLSARAIARRAAQGIPITENDLPVNPNYVKAVAAKGVTILNVTKWLNGVTIYTKDSSLVESIEDLPFVKKIIYFKNAPKKESTFFKNEFFSKVSPYQREKSESYSQMKYGLALTQIKQINGIPLQDSGYLGQNMVIAVLDGGFINVPNQVVFDSLRDQHRILGTKDFVIPHGNVYSLSDHGRMVLSVMAADDPGLMIGTAPKASYWLLRSEDVRSENVIEEYNWVSAAEFADSVGANIINSSLGYTSFDDTAYSYHYSDMNGKTAISTIGAEIAASKGILVVNSAGNSGNDAKFPWIGAPADGDSVFTIGAVDASGTRAYFSSIGPTYDGRIKPTVMAMGQWSTVANADSGVIFASGTSFSSPIIAGMSACLWQAHPRATNMQIIQALKETASDHAKPNNFMGWGIPNFAKADSLLTILIGSKAHSYHKTVLTTFPNPFHSYFFIHIDGAKGNIQVRIYNLSGQKVFQKTFYARTTSIMLGQNDLSHLMPGMYLLNVVDDQHFYFGKIVKE